MIVLTLYLFRCVSLILENKKVINVELAVGTCNSY